MPSIGLSDSEWRIMTLLWEQPMTMPQIRKSLDAETGWSKHTVISFLNRMMAKGAIETVEAKPARLYRPLIERDESLREETRSFVSRLFRGKAGLLVASLVEQEILDDQEIDDLMRMLEISRERKGPGK